MSSRQVRWMQLLSEYNLDMRAIPGVKNTAADALSRASHLCPVMEQEADSTPGPSSSLTHPDVMFEYPPMTTGLGLPLPFLKLSRTLDFLRIIGLRITC
jgi:hypothetical protein